MRLLALIMALLLVIPFALAHETDTEHLELPPGLVKVLGYQIELAASITFLLAFLAGIIGFVSPCSFAVFPAFFAFLFKERNRGVFLTIAFTFGMMLSFVLLGILAGVVGTFFNTFKREVAFISGIALIIFGIMMLLNKGFTFLTFKMDHPKRGKTFFSMTVLGFFFAIGWTPCVGPILSGILILAASTGSVLMGAGMMFAYSVGVAVPLLLIAFLSDKIDFAKYVQGKHYTLKLFGKKYHTHMYNIIGGLMLIGLGVVIWVFQGSQQIEQFLVETTPWTMDWLYTFNDALLETTLTSGVWNFVGLAIIVAIIAFVVWALRKKDKPGKFK